MARHPRVTSRQKGFKLNAGVDLGKTAIKSLAAVLVIDVVSDGDSDILGALFGG